jgi:hypothetical protein
VKRLLVATSLLLILASSSGCCLLRELLWHACPGGGCHRWNVFCIPSCLKHSDCCSGCGEMYWGEISDCPCPDCCEHGYGHCYPGYLPGGYQHHPVSYPMTGEPTPAEPVAPGRVQGRAPTDAEMGLPAGAKIIHRSDRVLAADEPAPGARSVARTSSPNPRATARAATSPPRVATRPTASAAQAQRAAHAESIRSARLPSKSYRTLQR